MKLKDSYFYNIEAGIVKLSKSLIDLKEEDFIPPNEIMRDITDITSYYGRANIVPIHANELLTLIMSKTMRFLSPDRSHFISALPASLPALLTLDPKTRKPIVIVEGGQSFKIVINKGKTGGLKEYSVINTVNLFNQVFAGATMYTFNKIPMTKQGSAAIEFATNGVMCYTVLMRRIYEKLFNLGTTRNSGQLNNLLYVTAIWASSNVFDIDNRSTCEMIAKKVVQTISIDAWDVPPTMDKNTLYGKLFGSNFKDFIEISGEVSLTGIKTHMKYIESSISSAYGFASPTAFEYLPYFAILMGCIESGSTNNGYNLKGIKDALRGTKEYDKFKQGVYAHLNTNLSKVGN